MLYTIELMKYEYDGYTAYPSPKLLTEEHIQELINHKPEGKTYRLAIWKKGEFEIDTITLSRLFTSFPYSCFSNEIADYVTINPVSILEGGIFDA